VTSLVKYSNSVVDVLSCFTKVCNNLYFSSCYCCNCHLSVLVWYWYFDEFDSFCSYFLCFRDNFCFLFQITSEWRDIDFADADICLLGVTKITDV